jgi:Raf kinase inhibitor-like YbhB/YbcL family protein
MTTRLVVTLAALLLACSQAPVKTQSGTTTSQPAPATIASFMVSSPAFADEEPIPARYSGKDTNYSPPLNWYGVPERTKSFVLIVEDPDAPMGTFTHWVAYNIPGKTKRLDENLPKDEILPDGMRQLKNDAGRIGWFGPLPPPGKVHHYIFSVYALDQELNPVGDKIFLLKAMEGHILGQGRLTGTYKS